jgi:hypothetical protein
VRHAFSYTDDQIREGDVGVDLHERSAVGSADNDVVRGMRVMRDETTLQTAEGLFPHLFLELFPCGNGVGSDSADSAYPPIGDAGAVESIEDFRQGEVDRGRPLKVIEKESYFHPRSGQLLKPLGSDGMIEGATDLHLWIGHPFHRRPIGRRNDVPSLGDAENFLLRFIVDIVIHGASPPDGNNRSFSLCISL